MMKCKEVFYVTYVERDIDGGLDETSVQLFGSYKDAKEKFDTIVKEISTFWDDQKEHGMDVVHDEYHSDAPCDIVSYEEQGYGIVNCSWVHLKSEYVYFDEEEGE